jgi:hypothetical protein
MKMISLSKAKEHLVKLWTIGFLLLFLFFFLQTVTQRYVGITNEAWGWFLPHLLPTLTIIIGGYFFDVNRKDATINIIPATSFKISYVISVSYFIIVFIIIFSYRNVNGNILEYYQSYNVVLSAIQSLISGSVVFLFTKQKLQKKTEGS